MNEGTCSVEDCDRQAWARGWCSKHYSRWYKHGDPTKLKTGDIRKPVVIGDHLTVMEVLAWNRLWDRLVEGPDGCWIWPVGKRYGRINIKGQRYSTHRLVWFALRDEPPEGLEPDHLCRTMACANPDHLDWVTAKVNMQRNNAPTMIAWRTNTCKRGHSLLDAYQSPNYPGRRCRICNCEQLRRAYTAKKRHARYLATGN